MEDKEFLDTSFIDLTKKENLLKIKIDKELIPTFIEAMKLFQKHFNKMGYTKDRDYQKFFSKYLISRYPISNIAIRFDTLKKPIDCMGICYLDKIVISREYENEPKVLLDIFVHEFIHFLVHHYVLEKKIEDESAVMVPFFDEALTELLKMEMLPYTTKSYFSYIKMVEFWYLVNGRKINMNEFLKGKIPDLNEEFREILNDYDEANDKEDKMYINIQRYILKNMNKYVGTLSVYEKLVEKISNRVVNDSSFINKFYGKLDNDLCDNLKIFDNKLRKRFKFYLKEYRLIIEEICKNKIDGNLKFTVDDEKYVINHQGHVYINQQYKFKKKYLKFVLQGKSKCYRIGLRNIDFNKIRSNQEKINTELEKKKKHIEDILNYIKWISCMTNASDIEKIKVLKR